VFQLSQPVTLAKSGHTLTKLNMNIDKSAIFSQCVYDVDNRYVDVEIQSTFGNSFVLVMTDTSDEEELNTKIELFLTRENLKIVIDRLTEVLNEQTN
jgi:hypothetical protein